MSNQVQIGLATADITPPVGITLSGYKPRTATEIGHRLRAEALVVRDGEGGAWALVTGDVIGYVGAYVAEVREKIAGRTALAPQAIVLAGTHTHSGPATIAFGMDNMAEVDAAYLGDLQETLADLVARAEAAAEPGAFEVAWTEAPNLGSNRRIQGDDGSWINEWQDPEGRHPGFFDPAVMLVAVRRPDGRRDALLVNFGCHPVVLGPQSLAVSADYPGYMKDAVEAALPGTTSLFALAGAGNINPRNCILEGAENPKAVGDRLAQVVLDAVEKLEPIGSQGPVASRAEPWTLVRSREAFKSKDRPGKRKGDEIAAEIDVLRAGDLALVTLPGELFSEFNAMLRQASPVRHTIIVSVANDYIGYLPTDAAQAEGAYETKMAPCEGIEGSLMDAARRAFGAVG